MQSNSRLGHKCESKPSGPVRMPKQVGTLHQSSAVVFTWLMKTIVVFIVGLLIATAWAQVDHAHGTVWLPNSIGTLNGRHNYQMGLRDDGVVVWRWSPYH